MASTSTSKTEMVPAQIDFYLRKVSAPKYKMLRVPMNNSSTGSISIGATESQPIEFKLPASKVYNLSRSYVSYMRSIPAQGAATSVWAYEDMFSLGNAITFGSAGGNDLVNLPYANNFSKIQRKLHTPTDEFLTASALGGLARLNALATANYVPGGSSGGITASDSYLEARYSSNVDSANVGFIAPFQYPLGAFHGTLLGVDRDFYAPVEQYLRITCGPGNKVAFSATAPVVGPPITYPDPTLNPQDIVAPVVFSQIMLYLAVEENMDIVASMMDTAREGKLKYSIPYTTGFKMAGNAAGMQTNVSISLTRQYGKRLKRVLHSVFNSQESKNTAYDHDNGNGAKIVTYQTFLDNVPLQDRVLDCRLSTVSSVRADDYLENKKFLGKQSAILGYGQYSLNWFHLDQFFEPHDLTEGSLPEVNLDEGVLMNEDRNWLFSGQSAVANPIHYTWAEFSREILITPDGAHFV